MKDDSGVEKEGYKIIFLHEFALTRERQAHKSVPMSKQVPLIMHQQHRHPSLKLSKNQPADMLESQEPDKAMKFV